MAFLSKRQKQFLEVVDPNKAYAIEQAIGILKNCATAKFRESVDIAVNLGVDAKKSDQNVRGSTVLPHGSGKSVRVAVFAQGGNADQAKEAGADAVGMEELASRMKDGDLNYQVVIAEPAAMRVVGGLGQLLGPRGLMPNPKTGTVTADVVAAVKNAKAGMAKYRTDKAGVVHCAIGSADFEVKDLLENLAAVLRDLRRLKPTTSKGQYIRRLTLSSTMGPGVVVDISSLPE